MTFKLEELLLKAVTFNGGAFGTLKFRKETNCHVIVFVRDFRDSLLFSFV